MRNTHPYQSSFYCRTASGTLQSNPDLSPSHSHLLLKTCLKPQRSSLISLPHGPPPPLSSNCPSWHVLTALTILVTLLWACPMSLLENDIQSWTGYPLWNWEMWLSVNQFSKPWWPQWGLEVLEISSSHRKGTQPRIKILGHFSKVCLISTQALA